MKKSLLGFTLLELLITLLIGGILVALAVPSFQNLVRNSRMTASHNSFMGELNFARSEAVKRGSEVAICASSNGTACNTAQWELGRLVYVDTTVDGERVAPEAILKTFPALDADVTLRAAAFSFTREVAYAPAATTNFDNALVFGSDGRLSHTGTLITCNNQGAAAARAVNMSVIGQPQKAMDTDSPADGIVNNVNGGNVTCP